MTDITPWTVLTGAMRRLGIIASPPSIIVSSSECTILLRDGDQVHITISDRGVIITGGGIAPIPMTAAEAEAHVAQLIAGTPNHGM